MIDTVTVVGIYFIIWWVSLFLVLPFGVRNQVDAGEIVPGSEPGAPVVPRVWRRLLYASLLAIPLTGLLLWGVSNPTLLRYWS